MISTRRITEAPADRFPKGTFRLSVPLGDRNLMDLLDGKKVCMVFDDRDFDPWERTVRDLVDCGCLSGSIKLLNFSAFLKVLPTLETDMLLVFSINPQEFQHSFANLERGMIEFRRNNPQSPVVMVGLYSSVSSAGKLLAILREKTLVDHLEYGPISHTNLVRTGASLLYQRASADAKV